MTNRVNKIGVVVAERRGSGQRPDRDPARRRPQPGQGREDHRHDRRAADVRLRAEPRGAERDREPAARAAAVALRPAERGAGQEANKGTPQGYYLFKTVKKKVTQKVKGKQVTKTQTSHKLIQGDPPFGALTRKQLLRPYKDGQPPNTEILKIPANREPVWCQGAGTARRRRERHLEGRQVLVHVQVHALVHQTDGTVVNPDGPPELTGKDLVESGITQDVDPNTGVADRDSLQFTGHGSKEFKAITKAEYDRGRVSRPGWSAGPAGHNDQAIVNQYAGHNAIVLDGQPPVDAVHRLHRPEPLARASRAATRGSSRSRRTRRRRQDLALVLQSGSLPVLVQAARVDRGSRRRSARARSTRRSSPRSRVC